MNRDQLIRAATKDIELGDARVREWGAHPYSDYLSAIAKLLLADMLPIDREAVAGASPRMMPPQDWENR